MDIKEYILEDQIIFSDTLSNQKEMFQLVAKIATKNGITANINCIIDKFQERENLGTTGLLDTFAIPHAQDSTINKAMIVIVVSKNEIPWETLDDSNVKIVFALLIPSIDKGSIHIEFLSTISTLLMNDDFRDVLKKSQNSSEIINLIKQHTN